MSGKAGNYAFGCSDQSHQRGKSISAAWFENLTNWRPGNRTGNSEPRQPSRPPENLQHHRRRQLSGIRILQRRVIARQQPSAARNSIFHPMPKDQFTAALQLFGPQQMRDHTVEANLPQAENHPQPRQRGDLLVQKRRAARNLIRQRLVPWWSAAHHRRNPRIPQRHSVIAMCRRWLRGKPRTMQQRIEKVS